MALMEVARFGDSFEAGMARGRLEAEGIASVLFGLDTGAEVTYVTTTLLTKLPRTPVAARRSSIVGLNPGRAEIRRPDARSSRR